MKLHESTINGLTIFRPIEDQQWEEDQQITRYMEAARRKPEECGKVAALTPRVKELCEKFTKTPPIMVEVKPYEGARAQRCFINAATYCDYAGGDVCLGYKIWDNGIYNFEFHAVHVGEDGEYTCVTPQLLNEDKVLFLPLVTMPAEEADERIRDVMKQYGEYHFFPKRKSDVKAKATCDKYYEDIGEGKVSLYASSDETTPKQRAMKRKKIDKKKAG